MSVEYFGPLLSEHRLIAAAASVLTLLVLLGMAWEKLATLVARMWSDTTAAVEAILDFRDRLQRRAKGTH